MKPIFLTIVPDDNTFVWELEVHLQNILNKGYDNTVHCLIFRPIIRSTWNPNILKLEEKFKNTNIKFFYYEGDAKLQQDTSLIDYIPLLRIYSLIKHFEKYPELSKESIYYNDSDTLWVKKLDFSRFTNDDICYLSDTSSYLNLQYLDNKINDCLPEKKQELIDFKSVDKLFQLCGISREIVENNNLGTGGAQYLLKPGLTKEFWESVYKDCIVIRSFLKIVNKQFFKDENNGYQSYCSDMWSLLWNLWKFGYKTECPEEMNFAWAPDKISKLKQVYIYHNAGVSANTMLIEGIPTKLFNKIKYRNNITSPHKNVADIVDVSQNYCSYFYVMNLINIQNPVF